MSDIAVSGRAAVINDTADEIGETNLRNGFREDWQSADTLDHMAGYFADQDAGNIIVKIDGDDRQITFTQLLNESAKTTRNNILAAKLMLATSELSEALETLRDHGANGVLDGEGNFGEEIADCMIRCMDMAHMLGIPIGDVIVRKMAINKNRPYKHGRKI